MPHVLELQDISKHYGEGDARVDALAEATFTVGRGELVALVGPSGSGKSTLLSIAGALLSPNHGRLLLEGEDITDSPAPERARLRLQKIGFIFQGANLISYLTGREQLQLIANLLDLSANIAGERASRLLDDLGMTERADHYPEELSGGERQRIAIARAMMNDPALILADEPTASLDSQRGRAVVELLAREVHERDKAAVLVTHDERLLDLVDRVVHIEDGRLVKDAVTADRVA